MTEAGEDAGLIKQAPGSDWARPFGMQYFDCYASVEHRVPREEHHAHTSARQLPHDLVLRG